MQTGDKKRFTVEKISIRMDTDSRTRTLTRNIFSVAPQKKDERVEKGFLLLVLCLLVVGPAIEGDL